MPDEPEVAGLLALMLLAHSRTEARVGRGGELITLEEQDRDRWDHGEIARATGILRAALRHGATGPYQLQAAIAACHAEATDAAATDWAQIAALYGLLAAMAPSAVVQLNRAVAVAMAGRPERALEIVDDLSGGGDLDGYHLLDATRADLLRRAGRNDEAAGAYTRALALAPSEPERRFLERRLAEVRGGR